eukprot:8350199-Pyramimonas_sp.AAC.1
MSVSSPAPHPFSFSRVNFSFSSVNFSFRRVNSSRTIYVRVEPCSAPPVDHRLSTPAPLDYGYILSPLPQLVPAM